MTKKPKNGSFKHDGPTASHVHVVALSMSMKKQQIKYDPTGVETAIDASPLNSEQLWKALTWAIKYGLSAFTLSLQVLKAFLQ